jgi:hypothetical protein
MISGMSPGIKRTGPSDAIGRVRIARISPKKPDVTTTRVQRQLHRLRRSPDRGIDKVQALVQVVGDVDEGVAGAFSEAVGVGVAGDWHVQHLGGRKGAGG